MSSLSLFCFSPFVSLLSATKGRFLSFSVAIFDDTAMSRWVSSTKETTTSLSVDLLDEGKLRPICSVDLVEEGKTATSLSSVDLVGE
ncbi:hypothetical protein F2Q70_00003062 [Brassica cretica]|uniref:Secreted protein n=1 Tax=Brassica cretica TaxID=69181 RepID=A0A8S9IVA1_BRACR|nr:hypothetical protein F2Q70_00003062 [Brassica cretica]KAF3566077.1 hypothetical protein DY000_02014746 [Brassica cretica]